eukprot:GSChrysophyteH1.ASY1.ANO1.1230.1 assembled CDS
MLRFIRTTRAPGPFLRAVKNMHATQKDIPVIPSGLLVVRKPSGWGSTDVVNHIKNILLIGHGGALDPMATGVLVLGIGAGTRVMSAYLSGPKSYQAIALLGSETDTLDATGKVVATTPYAHVTPSKIEESIRNKFVGEISQIPPMYSAVHVNGKRLYELARKGLTVERKPRIVQIYKLNLTKEPLPQFGLDISCSGGTYIRSLISDIAQDVGSSAHMTSLMRVSQGPFDIDLALKQRQWKYEHLIQHILNCSAHAQLDMSIVSTPAVTWKGYRTAQVAATHSR